jgi:hypothetical protein
MTLCECGCGESAPIARVTWKARGWVKGQPVRFVHGHNGRPRLRFEDVVDIQGPDGCWEWTSTRMSAGYGQMWDGTRGRTQGAHRLFYEAFIGPIPEGLELDHLCRNRACVRPDHLEPVTRRENLLRGAGTKLHPDRHGELMDHFRASDLARADFSRRYAADYGVSASTVAHLLALLDKNAAAALERSAA